MREVYQDHYSKFEPPRVYKIAKLEQAKSLSRLNDDEREFLYGSDVSS